MAIRTRFNRQAKLVSVYLSDSVAGVDFYNLETPSGGPSARVVAVAGIAEDLEQVGYYGFDACSSLPEGRQLLSLDKRIETALLMRVNHVR